jgi:hypothetical protein
VSGPHDFCVRVEIVRLRNERYDPTRPPHPALNVRDDREAPLERVRDGADDACDLGSESSLILKNRIRRLRQIGTTGSSCMVRMRDLPVAHALRVTDLTASRGLSSSRDLSAAQAIACAPIDVSTNISSSSPGAWEQSTA